MSLCFLLWRGNTRIFTATQDAHHTHHNHSPQKVRFTNQDYSLITDDETDIEDEYIIGDDDIDDDSPNDFLAQQFRLLAMCYASIPRHSILSYHRNRYKGLPSFSGQISHKYILQGVLRI